MSGLFSGEQIATGSIPVDKLGANNFVTTTGNSTITGDLSITGNLKVDGDLLPSTSTSNIGNEENKWNSVNATNLSIQTLKVGAIEQIDPAGLPPEIIFRGDVLTGGTINGVNLMSSGTGTTFLADNGQYLSISETDFLPLSAGRENTLGGPLYTIDILPADANEYDIGSVAVPYDNAYFNTIYIGNLSPLNANIIDCRASLVPTSTILFDLGSESLTWNLGYINEIHTTEIISTGDIHADGLYANSININNATVVENITVTRINNINLTSEGDGTSYLANDGTYKSVTSPYTYKEGSITASDSSVELEIGNTGLTLGVEYKDGATGRVRLKGTSVDVVADVYRTSVYNGASEGQAFDNTTFTTTGTLIDDTIYLASNDRITVDIGVGSDFYEAVILVSQAGAVVRMAVTKFS